MKEKLRGCKVEGVIAIPLCGGPKHPLTIPRGPALMAPLGPRPTAATPGAAKRLISRINQPANASTIIKHTYKQWRKNSLWEKLSSFPHFYELSYSSMKNDNGGCLYVAMYARKGVSRVRNDESAPKETGEQEAYIGPMCGLYHMHVYTLSLNNQGRLLGKAV